MTRLPVEIPFAVRVGAAARHGQPTVVLEPDSRVRARLPRARGLRLPARSRADRCMTEPPLEIRRHSPPGFARRGSQPIAALSQRS